MGSFTSMVVIDGSLMVVEELSSKFRWLMKNLSEKQIDLKPILKLRPCQCTHHPRVHLSLDLEAISFRPIAEEIERMVVAACASVTAVAGSQLAGPGGYEEEG
ncbi:hypothetical protein C1H46_042932 [Malus baccata]|uniref:Uncharacterized protein n=1 Tax=Malus baccata TaxID=106549 RepID=A0A540KBM1_MALBA|nr:hypothetical protein C1H46_042932 [Malus baccata]